MNGNEGSRTTAEAPTNMVPTAYQQPCICMDQLLCSIHPISSLYCQPLTSSLLQITQQHHKHKPRQNCMEARKPTASKQCRYVQFTYA
jgi:hypothetical protein